MLIPVELVRWPLFHGCTQFGAHDRTSRMDNLDERGATSVVLKSFTKVANAGDAFSACLAAKWFGMQPELVGADEQDRENLLLVGSILHWADLHSIVCGAGFISAEARLQALPSRICLVRGPRTHELLQLQGVQAPGRYADPGVLAPRLFAPLNPVRGRVGVVPHYKDLDTPWVSVCADRGVHVIDPTQPLPDYFNALQSCEVILSSSLHGLVFAHAFGRPAAWIELGNRVLGDGFKFLDYYASLGVSDDRVRRLRVGAGDDPLAIAELATCPSTSRLAANAEEALHELAGEIRQQ